MAEPPAGSSHENDDQTESDSIESRESQKQRLIDRLPGGSPGLRTPTHDAIPGLRVPKEKLRLAEVSLELPDALAVLADQIDKAEEFLRKQPGADRAHVALDDVYLPDLHVGTQAFLETSRDNRGNCNIVVSYYHNDTETCLATARLEEFPIATRIDICKSIPRLIEAAVAAQSIVANDVLTVAEAIDKALEQNRDSTM